MRLRVGLTVALAVALVLAACGKDSSEESHKRRTTTTAPPTTPRTAGPQTVPVPPAPPPPPASGPPPAITVPPGAPGPTTTPTTMPRTTTEPDDPFFGGAGHYPNVSDKPAAFVGFYGRYDGTQRNPTRYYGGPPESSDPTVKERYAKAYSIARAADAAGPALLAQGDADQRALVESATKFHDALQAAGKDATLTLVPGAGNGFDQMEAGALTPAGQQVAQQVLEWLGARFPPG